MKQQLLEKLFEMAKYDAGYFFSIIIFFMFNLFYEGSKFRRKFEDVKNLGETAVRQMMHEQVYINIPNYGTR